MTNNDRLKNLYIYGSNMMNNEILKLIKEINDDKPTWRVLGFINDITTRTFEGYSSIMTAQLIPYLQNRETIYLANNIDSTIKSCSKYIRSLLSCGCEITSLVSPSVDLVSVVIGRGCLIPRGCIIGYDTQIGSFVTIRLAVTIGSNVIIKDYSFVGPGAIISEGCILEKGSFVGQGAIIMPGVRIGEKATIGAGAVVTENVEAFDTIIGVPGKILKR